jgi:hypothetical protein
MAQGERPLGVTIIGILFIIGGIIALIGGGLGGLAMSVLGLGIVGLIFGGILAIIGIVYIILGIGCFKGWGWVWTLAVIFAVLGIIMQIASLAMTGTAGIASVIIGILINAVILWYLFQANVKQWFGKV